MPPAPETPGTPQADIYALGMMLFVLSTGRDPTYFPEIATTIVNSANLADYVHLNKIILLACETEPTRRYATAGAMRQALQAAQAALDQGGLEKAPLPVVEDHGPQGA